MTPLLIIMALFTLFLAVAGLAFFAVQRAERERDSAVRRLLGVMQQAQRWERRCSAMEEMVDGWIAEWRRKP